MKVMIELKPPVVALLKVLDEHGDVKAVINRLIDHAQQGVYRPGAWEREWICQVFSTDWQLKMQRGDPYGRPNCEDMFQKPMGAGNLAQLPERLIARGAA